MTDKTMTPAPTLTPRTDAFLANPCRDPWGLDADDVLRLIDFARTLERELADAKRDIERAYQMLEIEGGVTRERARSVSNGIGVMATRMRREIQDLEAALRARPGVDAEPVAWVNANELARHQGVAGITRDNSVAFMVFAGPWCKGLVPLYSHPTIPAPPTQGATQSPCACIRAERPLCHPDCWHFGNNQSWCRNCGEGNPPAQPAEPSEDKP